MKILMRVLLWAGIIATLWAYKEYEKEIDLLREDIEQLEEKKEDLEDERDRLYQDLLEKDKRIKELEDIKLFTMEATAYTDDYASQGKWIGQTATGLIPQVGVVAVDPRVIPLGTELYIEGYGQAIAGDTGGAIKGNRIDLFMATRGEALKYGRKNIRVRVVK